MTYLILGVLQKYTSTRVHEYTNTLVIYTIVLAILLHTFTETQFIIIHYLFFLFLWDLVLRFKYGYVA